MKPITTSIFTFEKLVEGGYVYVDKTARLYDLIMPPYGVYFLSRPRRFGKSLTISSLEGVFRRRLRPSDPQPGTLAGRASVSRRGLAGVRPCFTE